MRRPRPSFTERQKLVKQLENSQFLDQRRRKLYNRKYRKSFLFISIWAGRLIYIILFFVISFLHDKSGGFREEIVINKNIESYINSSKRGSYKVTNLYIETNYSNYTAKFGNSNPPNFEIRDTLFIERNIFHKPIHFTKAGWYMKYGLHNNFIYYYLVLFLTFISLFFNDGLDRFTDKILLIIWAANIIGIACYFLT